jgi:phage tail-like protein
MITTNFADYLYFEVMPRLYREYDTNNEFRLYIESLCEGGFNEIISGENTFLDLIDPYNCPEPFLPVFCNCFGIKYYPSIPAVYHRKLLANIGELVRRRGTYNCVRFLCRVLTGMEIDYRLEYKEDWVEGSGESKTLFINLKAETLADVSNIDLSIKVVSLFILDFIPYYINSVMITHIVNDVPLTIPVYRTGVVFTDKEYILPVDYTY